MKKNELKEIRALETDGIKAKVSKAKEELISLVMDKNMKKLKDVKAVFKKRKDIAQMLTILRQKQLLEKLRKEEA